MMSTDSSPSTRSENLGGYTVLDVRSLPVIHPGIHTHALGSPSQTWPVSSTYNAPVARDSRPPSDITAATFCPSPSTAYSRRSRPPGPSPANTRGFRPRNSRLGYFSSQPLAPTPSRRTRRAPVANSSSPRHAILSIRGLACALRHVTLSVSLNAHPRASCCPLRDGRQNMSVSESSEFYRLFFSRAMLYFAVINSLIILTGQTREGWAQWAALSCYETPRGERGNGKK